MKLGKKDIKRISDMALTVYKDQHSVLSWDTSRDFIDETEKRTIAYITALSIVTDVDIDIEYYKQHGKTFKREGK